MEAPASVIDEYKYKAAQNCFLAFADIIKKGDLKVVLGDSLQDAFTDQRTGYDHHNHQQGEPT